MGVFLFLLATWPFLLSITWPDMLYARPVPHILFGGMSVGLAFIVWLVLALVCRSQVDTPEVRRQIVRRPLIIFGAAILFIILHATAIPLRMMFVLHYPLFAHAKATAAQSLSPGSGLSPRGWIGLFPVTGVFREPDGDVAFSIGEGGIFYNTPGTVGWPFVPPGNGGPLIGNWEWLVTD